MIITEGGGRRVRRLKCDGTVSHAAALDDSPMPERMKACVADAVKRLTFPYPGETGATLTYPFNFKPD